LKRETGWKERKECKKRLKARFFFSVHVKKSLGKYFEESSGIPFLLTTFLCLERFERYSYFMMGTYHLGISIFFVSGLDGNTANITEVNDVHVRCKSNKHVL